MLVRVLFIFIVIVLIISSNAVINTTDDIVISDVDLVTNNSDYVDIHPSFSIDNNILYWSKNNNIYNSTSKDYMFNGNSLVSLSMNTYKINSWINETSIYITTYKNNSIYNYKIDYNDNIVLSYPTLTPDILNNEILFCYTVKNLDYVYAQPYEAYNLYHTECLYSTDGVNWINIYNTIPNNCRNAYVYSLENKNSTWNILGKCSTSIYYSLNLYGISILNNTENISFEIISELPDSTGNNIYKAASAHVGQETYMLVLDNTGIYKMKGNNIEEHRHNNNARDIIPFNKKYNNIYSDTTKEWIVVFADDNEIKLYTYTIDQYKLNFISTIKTFNDIENVNNIEIVSINSLYEDQHSFDIYYQIQNSIYKINVIITADENNLPVHTKLLNKDIDILEIYEDTNFICDRSIIVNTLIIYDGVVNMNCVIHIKEKIDIYNTYPIHIDLLYIDNNISLNLNNINTDNFKLLENTIINGNLTQINIKTNDDNICYNIEKLNADYMINKINCYNDTSNLNINTNNIPISIIIVISCVVVVIIIASVIIIMLRKNRNAVSYQ